MSILPSGGPQKLPFRCYARDPADPLFLGPASYLARSGMHGSADRQPLQRGRAFCLWPSNLASEEIKVGKI
jgi:hypothetical protein